MTGGYEYEDERSNLDTIADTMIHSSEAMILFHPIVVGITIILIVWLLKLTGIVSSPKAINPHVSLKSRVAQQDVEPGRKHNP